MNLRIPAASWAVLLVLSLTPPSRPATSDALDGLGVLADWTSALTAIEAAPDPEAATAIYLAGLTEDAVLMFPDMPAIRGRKEIRRFLLDLFQGYRFELSEWETDELRCAKTSRSIASMESRFSRLATVATLSVVTRSTSTFFDEEATGNGGSRSTSSS